MAISIKALNSDTSFLISLSPPCTPVNTETPERFPGSFTILVDPWFTGPATFVNSKVSQQYHTKPSCVESIKELQTPDMVLITQDKPDHCHRQTLCELDQLYEGVILAPRHVVNKIKGWSHFHEECLSVLPRFNATSSKTVFRLCIPGMTSNMTDGEVTVCLLEPKRDFAGVHNAIGITYRPPGSVLSKEPMTLIDLPPSPTSVRFPYSPSLPTDVTWPRIIKETDSPDFPDFTKFGIPDQIKRSPVTNGFSPSTGTITKSKSSSTTTTSSSRPSTATEKAVSILYSPHGVDYSVIQPWATSHLVPSAALPLSILIHSLTYVRSPWFMGGVMANGAEGGIEIARNLMPKVWIGAHDEEKIGSGFGLLGIVKKEFGIEEVKRKLAEAMTASSNRGKDSKDSVSEKPVSFKTDVVVLEAGEQKRIGFAPADKSVSSKAPQPPNAKTVDKTKDNLRNGRTEKEEESENEKRKTVYGDSEPRDERMKIQHILNRPEVKTALHITNNGGGVVVPALPVRGRRLNADAMGTNCVVEVR